MAVGVLLQICTVQDVHLQLQTALSLSPKFKRNVCVCQRVCVRKCPADPPLRRHCCVFFCLEPAGRSPKSSLSYATNILASNRMCFLRGKEDGKRGQMWTCSFSCLSFLGSLDLAAVYAQSSVSHSILDHLTLHSFRAYFL